MKSKMMMIIYIAILGLVGLGAYIRLAPSDPALWHQDPETVVFTSKPNEYRLIGDLAPVYNMAASELAALVDDLIAAQPRVTRLAGSPETLMMTYVQRSMSMGYPDYITFRVVPVGNGQSKLEILSRSRFGRSDLGVNKLRIKQWVGLIDGLVFRQ